MPPSVRPRRKAGAPKSWRAASRTAPFRSSATSTASRAYYVVYAGDDTVTAISIFDKFEQAEEANRRAIAWIEKDLGPLLAGHASAAAGPVIVHTLA